MRIPQHSRPHYGASILVAVIAVTSCGPAAPEARACTLIGCESGVAVDLSATPSGAFSVELTPIPGGEATLKECTTAASCGRSLFFAGVSADSVEVKVTTAAGTRSVRTRAAYFTSQPNGPQCDPTCRQARVAVELP